MANRIDIKEYIEVTQQEDGRICASVRLVGDPNGLVFSIVRDTYAECMAEWRKFDGWMEG